MKAGRLYHRVKFYPKVTTRDSYGSSDDTWPTATISTRGEIIHRGGAKTLSNEERFFSKSKELTIRYRRGITETMRVQIDGAEERYAITYIEEIGRQEGLRMTLEKINM